MNYTQLNEEVKAAALGLPNVNTYTEGDVYVNWHNGIKYSAVNMGLESIDRTSNTVIYNIVLYYADRPTKDESNKLSIYDDGVHVLQSILDVLPDSISYLTPINYIQFEQLFEDNLFGVYARIALETEYELGKCGFDMADPVVKTLDISTNGKYNVKVFDYVDVSVNGTKPAVLEEIEKTIVNVEVDGSFTLFPSRGYDGFSKATIHINSLKEEKTVNITENGTTVITPNPNTHPALSKVTINTNIANVIKSKEELTIEEYEDLEEKTTDTLYIIENDEGLCYGLYLGENEVWQKAE